MTKPKRVRRTARTLGVSVWNLLFGIWKFVSNFEFRISNFRRRCADQGGATSVEYVLLLITFVLPMMVVLKMLLDMLIYSYRMATYWMTLPFP